MMTNDNFYLKSIASGEVTGAYETHLYYMGIISGMIIKLGYMLLPKAPMFGMFFCFSTAAMLSYTLYRLLFSCKRMISAALLLFAYLFTVYAFFIQHIIKTEFTAITGFVGAEGIFSMFLLEEEKPFREYLKVLIPFVIFSLWSVGMRDKAYLMLLPFEGMILLGKLLSIILKKNHKAEEYRNFAALLIAFIAVTVIGCGMNAIAYSGNEWKEFKRYTDASEKVYDFYGYPDYDENEELYSGLGITRSSYIAATEHYNILLDPAINADSMERLAYEGELLYNSKRGSFSDTIKDIFQKFIERNFTTYTERPINILAYLLYIIVFILAVLSKSRRAVFDICCIFFAGSFLWVYLIYGGRFPSRVTQIIFVCEIVLLVGVVIKRKLWEKKPAGIFLYVGIILIILSAIRFGLPVAKKQIGEVQSWYDFSVCFRELEEYLSKHPENRYYFDMSHLYYMEETLGKPGEYENYVYMGSWMPNSPWYDEKLRSWGIEDVGAALIDKKDVYLIYQPVDFDTRDFLDDYYAEHYPGSRLRVVDRFVASNGMEYEILKGYRE